MRKIIYFLTIFIIYSLSVTAQRCVSLGCSKNTTITTDGSGNDLLGPGWGCYLNIPVHQVLWQYFYAPTGGNYSQVFTNTGGADLDWAVFDIGNSLTSATCPVSIVGWTQIQCNISPTAGAPTGPGVDGIVSTVAGHYYAVAVILWEPVNVVCSFGTPQIGGSNLTPANCPGVLPIKLISFTGELQDKNVLLKWTVAEEINVSHYEVESSEDARNFKTIGNVSTNSSYKYSLRHSDPVSSTGVIYYRLKTVDLDGKVSYSSVIKILIKGTSRLQITQNPVISNLNISGLSSRGQIKIIDLTGKVLLEKKVQTQAMSINIPFIQTGMYLLQYTDGTKTETQKFLKR